MDSGNATGIPNFYTVMYNQVEQGYIAGYLAGLVTKSKMTGANADLKIGAIVAQEYPALNKEMIPGYQQGAQAVDPKITLDYRVIGNWYDANKAADLANSMMDAGVDVILSISGGASQGIIKAAQARGKYVIYFDSDQYAIAPGTIIGCVTLDQTRAVYEALKQAVGGNLEARHGGRRQREGRLRRPGGQESDVHQQRRSRCAREDGRPDEEVPHGRFHTADPAAVGSCTRDTRGGTPARPDPDLNGRRADAVTSR